MSYLTYDRTPETALDDLIAEQAMDNHRHTTPPDEDRALVRRYRSLTATRCRECGCFGGHQPGCPEGY